MKKRLGFVSNSSSSSFVCDICGDAYEVSTEDMEFPPSEFICENGHSFCSSHVNIDIEKEFIKLLENKYSIILEDRDDIYDKYYDDLWNFKESLPEKYCPLCNIENISNKDLIFYLNTKYNIDKDKILEELKTSFSNINEIYNDEKMKVHLRKLKLKTL